ncbi:branched-chain amino acid ABC transporter permease [Bordetella holmesii]|uniref:Branched-chain amino acid ABC transporter, permease domain protein n=2 Tax=Bordetella holmesii TaxID=35814 RepID=A0A158M6S5_9BORD|nr:branched-chain amino acid ABC transporter permease [Bordetella holmesii]AIT26667.1 branched-chain amino acid transport system / permease component family protein [Bordetella holmesii 44057]EWM41669.1 branched-chain amino acid transport system / permease component family protein [Bordetella holmesii 41130]EWM47251.1 branched-chain amino acid transport system / permease component family protein [Bordetella holmesii 35009]EWM51408.1 branched-chain amino acid transport system / permease componen
MDPGIFLIHALNALQYGLLLFLVASGLTLIFGIMGIINLAHGSFYMIGAYMAFALGPLVQAHLGGGFFVTLAVCVAAAVLYWVVTRTRIGMMVRAGASNREMIGSLGVNINRLYRWVFAVDVAMAALAGALAAPVSSVYPGMGQGVLIICFVVVVIGGIGSIRGTFLAAMLVAAIETFGQVLFPAAAGVLVYLLMATILLFRPEGLFRQG